MRHCTRGAADLLETSWLDVARTAEQDASYANMKGDSRHRPALPLFHERDAERVARLVERHGYHERLSAPTGR